MAKYRLWGQCGGVHRFKMAAWYQVSQNGGGEVYGGSRVPQKMGAKTQPVGVIVAPKGWGGIVAPHGWDWGSRHNPWVGWGDEHDL